MALIAGALLTRRFLTPDGSIYREIARPMAAADVPGWVEAWESGRSLTDWE